MTRRAFLSLMLTWLGLLSLAAPAWAKDGDSSSDSSGSDSSGSGSDNSGSGSGGDDDDNSGSGSGNSGKNSEHDRAMKAVSSGRAMSLEDAMKRLGGKYSGRVIDVSLGKEGKRLVYRFKVKSDQGVVRKVIMDAATGDIRGIFGF